MASVANRSERAVAPVPVKIPTHLRASTSRRICNPLDPDEGSDVPVITTDRRLRRLAIVAADTASRFAREGLSHDPVAWLLAPRVLFDGRCALEACQEREPFFHATILHGLSLGLDAQVSELRALLSEDEPVEVFDDDVDLNLGEAADGDEIHLDDPAPPTMRLYSCIVEGPLGAGERCVQAFCAMVVPDEGWARRRLTSRYGAHLADAASIREGFDCECALAEMLLSDSMRRMLAAAARNPAGELGRDLDVQVEQRFAA